MDFAKELEDEAAIAVPKVRQSRQTSGGANMRLLHATLLFLVLATTSLAQPVFRSVNSIDASVLNAKSVMIARLSARQPSPADGQHQPWPVELEAIEALKGDPIHSANVDATIEQIQRWRATAAPLLVCEAAGGKPAEVIDLDAKDLFVFKQDLAGLDNRESLISYVRALVQRYPQVHSTQLIGLDPGLRSPRAQWPKLLGGFLTVNVPVDDRLEGLALRWISHRTSAVRMLGLWAIRPFKSDRNIDRVKAMLADRSASVVRQAETNFGEEERIFPVRMDATRTLDGWKVKYPATQYRVTESKIESVRKLYWWTGWHTPSLERLLDAKRLEDLTITSVPLTKEQLSVLGKLTWLRSLKTGGLELHDEDIEVFSGLKNLESLHLDANPLTDGALRTFAGLPKLKELSLAETDVTNHGLDTLRRARPDITVTPTRAQTSIFRYIARMDTAGVRRVLDNSPEAIDQRDSFGTGNTPLHAAAEGRLEIAKLLLDRGAPVDALNFKQQTPLQLVSYLQRDIWTRLLLLGHGADPNHKDVNGRTAAQGDGNQLSSPWAVRLMLACGADPQAMRLWMSRYAFNKERARDVEEMIASYIDRKPLPRMIVQSEADCAHIYYELRAGNTAGWSTAQNDPLSGPLAWNAFENGRAFLGPFGRQTVTFSLHNLPSHKNTQIEVELFLIGSWDGNGGLGNGPDIIDITVPGIGTALHSSFFNNTEDGLELLPMQSFPDPYGAGYHPGFTGAAERRTLIVGPKFGASEQRRSSVYKLRFTFEHTSPDLDVVLTGLTVPEVGIAKLLDDETWGIGSFVVRTD